ncbi:MAG: DUF881 domain-containing protein [Clostridiales bacterium]|nr:DUF881 domain-containing protein [Clostridiales bacterium]
MKEGRTKRGIVFILSLMVFLLTFLICWQIKTVKVNSEDVLKLQREDELRDEVLKWKQMYENVSENLNVTEATLQEYRDNAIQGDKTSELLKKELEQVNAISGITDIKGEGITITLKDAEILDPNFLAEDQIVHDTDILKIVNELRASGAEAISINEQRVINTTAIRCVGPTILVNDVKIGAPFVIKAIGNSDTLYSGMNLTGGIVYTLKKYNIQVDIKQSEEVEIPKYEGALTLKYAKGSDGE